MSDFAVRCPLCGAALLSADVSCPACLLRAGLAASEGVETTAPTQEGPAAWREDEDGAPAHVGPYTVLGVLGEGGMGIVYLAEQSVPIRRRVALKLVKPGMDSRDVLRRFEAEREALALMDHPHIARVLDAGLGPGGRPFFVMEYVPGLSITDYCDRHRLNNAERMALFLPICAAVQHAHQKGVIHRDLKPSNILVMVADGKPLPKVIDFGIAKAIHYGAAGRAVVTEMGRFVGTPEYMSPEQAEASGLEVDATTDIYSLGVVLYELLVGALPFDPKQLRLAAYGEIQRIIRDQDPPKPSTRAGTLGAPAGDVAKRRQTTPAGLTRQVRGDLDAIAMKAIEKDPARRYPSASEFAADIERYLRGDVVVARPPSVVYRATKFVRRHRVGLAAAGMVVLALVAGLVVSTVFFVQARRDRTLAGQQTYAAAISSADALTRSGDTAQALAQLEEAPARLRGWEWHHLVAAADTSIATLPVSGAGTTLPYRHSRFAFAPDGESVSWHTEGSVATWHARSHLPRDTRAVQGRILALGPGGLAVMRGPRDSNDANSLRVLNLETGTVVRELPPNAGPPDGALFSPDGRTLLVSYEGSGVAAWDLEGDSSRRTLTDTARAYAFNKDGSRLLVVARDQSLVALAWPSGRRISVIRSQGGELSSAAFSADGATVAAGYADGTVRVWTLAGPTLQTLLSRHEGSVTALGFSPDADRVVSGGTDGIVRVWDIAGSRLVGAVSPRRIDKYVMAVAYSPDGREIWVASDLNFTRATVQVWNASRMGAYHELITRAAAESMAYAPDGRRLVVGYDDGAARIWDTQTAAVVSTIQLARNDGMVRAVAFHPQGRWVATALGASLSTWDAASGKSQTLMSGHTDRIEAVVFSPAGTEVASGGRDGSVRIWDTTSGREVARWQGTQPVWTVAFDAAGSAVVFGTGDSETLPSRDARVRIWDWRVNRIVAQTADGEIASAVSSVAVNPIDGRIGVSQWGSTEILEYANELQARIRTLTTGSSAVRRVAFAPDGSRLLHGGSYGEIGLWSDWRPTPLLRLGGHEGATDAIAMSPDGSQVSVVSGGRVRLWNAAKADKASAPLGAAQTLDSGLNERAK